MNKSQLRRHLRQLRSQILPHQRRAAANSLLQVAMRERLLLRYSRIGFYLPFEGEMDMLPLLNQALRLGKSCYLPVVPRRFQKHLYFTRITARPSWYINRFGIHEHWSPRPIRASRLDLLFMPLVGFDEEGFRLGMGGGFYDTSLAFLGRRKIWRKPYLVGIGYENQKVEQVPRDSWDMPLDAALTEHQLYRFRRNTLSPI
ncbi:MAG: 5-formyltetrahydrofolate cyclo-ligase [Sulfurimicrobium sp.]|nr:5-formyltetrahydrofolate cyclo-ligase [Sulfurimicrobium sp.]MDZ7656734.1 5-formyltetrahydrofolate cyclo-ligase [Sulfurimicrobium sp.]